jgi:hypothetical protein
MDVFKVHIECTATSKNPLQLQELTQLNVTARPGIVDQSTASILETHLKDQQLFNLAEIESL